MTKVIYLGLLCVIIAILVLLCMASFLDLRCQKSVPSELLYCASNMKLRKFVAARQYAATVD